MTKWTNDLTNYLTDEGYDATNDITNVIVDDVDDVNQLFETVVDIHHEEDIEQVNWKFTMVHRPNVVYIDRHSPEEV